MAEEPTDVYINAGATFKGVWPSFLPKPGDDFLLDSLFLTAPFTIARPGLLVAETKLKVFSELAFVIPVLPDFSLVLGGEGGATVVPIHVEILPDLLLRLEDLDMALRIRGELLRPARRAAIQEGEPARWEVDPNREFIDVRLSNIALTIASTGDIGVATNASVDLPPAMIGDSGIVVQARDISFHLDASQPPPAGQPAGFRGIHLATATLALPGELGELVGELAVNNAAIGTGGFSGDVSTTFSPGKSVKFYGLDLSLEHVEISLRQNAFTAASLRGEIILPFFEEPIEVEIGFTLTGDFTVRLANDDGLLVLSKDGVFDLTVESLAFEVEDGLFTTILSGKLKPTLGAGELDWPTFDVRELAIDSNGNVRLDGGWLSLPSAYTLNFYGFQFEITKLGFGKNDDGSKWIGLNGALRLVEGMQAGASVEGLRLTWAEGQAPSLGLNGVGVELEIPNSLRFKGFVAFRDLPGGVRRFDGNLTLELLALNLSVDAQIVFGHANNADGSYNFMGLFLGVELPAGIPLFTTGLGLYGMAGLFASQLAPNKAPAEEWYADWYKDTPEGVAKLEKWTNKRDALGVGAGVTIGTLGDNGYAFSGRLLLLLLFPGPVIMIEGRANILKKRSELDEEPLFKTLAVLDFNVGTFLFAVDAQYRFDDGGKLIEIGGSAEAYFNLNNPGDWHFWLGQREPRDKRIRARIFQLFEANSYFMLDASSLAMGAWFGYDKTWKFGPLRVTVELWAEGHAGVSFRPPNFSGGIRVHGGVRLRAFGIGLGLSVEVGLEATVFDPFHIVGDFRVNLETPWPLPDVGATVKLEWGPRKVWPQLPLPLAEVAVEHVKVSTSWPLPRGTLLLPDYDAGGGMRNTVPATIPEPNPSAEEVRVQAPPAGAPVVPMDARPRLTFGRQVHDDALVGVNGRVPAEFERIGDPAKNEGPVRVSYRLREIRLEKWTGASTWQTVARKAASDLPPNDSGVEVLYGSWAPVPDFTPLDGTGDAGGHNQSKLWLWSANPFDYTRRVGRSWDEWFTDHFPNYPCVTPDSPKETCYDFDDIPLSTPLDNGPSSLDPYVPSYRHPDNTDVEIIVDDAAIAGVPLVQTLPAALEGHQRGACFTPLPAAIPDAPPPPTTSPLVNDLVMDLVGQTPVPPGNKALLILMPLPNAGVRMVISPEATVLAYDEANVQHTAAPAPRPGGVAEVLVPNLRLVVAYWNTNVCFAGVCSLRGPTQETITRIGLTAQHNVDSVERFEAEGFVFESQTNYRLQIVTLIDAVGEGELDSFRKATQTEFAFFRTEGPPKLADLTIPLGREQDDQLKLKNVQGELVHNDGTPVGMGAPVLASELNELGVYVRQTLPATVPAPGEQPDLPRPVYRAYDLGVEFNENYVQLMYRLDARDLSLYLFDQNNQPIRDTEGRVLVLRSGWDVSDEPTVDTSEMVWITTLQASTCAGSVSIDIARDEKLTLAGPTLEADTIYDARLTPLLIHEDFSDDDIYTLGAAAAGTGATLGRWTVEDQGGGTDTSNWVIAERGDPPTRLVRQTSDYFAGSTDGRVPEKPGTVLWLHDRPELPPGHQDQPSAWTDYRVSAILRGEDDDAMGLVFRRASATRYYRFSLDRERKYRRLTLHFDGSVVILGEDEFVFQRNVDYEIAIEAFGSSLVVYQDGDLVFSVEDAAVAQGTIGLYCWSLQTGTFADIRVDDFRPTARTVFTYRFTTSIFSNFAHQIHSYQDETWTTEVDAEAVNLLGSAVPSSQAPSASEHRAWDALEGASALDSVMRAPVNGLEVTRLVDDEQLRGLLVRSPEPIAVNRTTLELFRADTEDGASEVPKALKLTGVSRHASDPNQESVSLVVREAFDPSDSAIEHLRMPPLLYVPGAGQFLLEEQFQDEQRGLLFQETFGPNTLDLYDILDQGTSEPSNWTVDAGSIFQSSNIFDGPTTASNLEKLGTMALRGAVDWRNVRVRFVLSSNDNDSIGVVFRYRDADNYYRFELNRQFSYRRLIKRVSGVVSVLWEDSANGYELGVDYEIEILLFERQIFGFVNRASQFAVEDASLELGRIGLYCWGNDDSRFKAVTVSSLDRAPLLLSPPSDLSGFSIADGGTNAGPSAWQVTGGAIQQTSDIHTASDTGVLQLGTLLLAGFEGWRDVRAGARIASTAGRAVGVVFRAVDALNYYRFSIDSTAGYRRLIKVVNGTASTLWEDGVAYSVGAPHDINIAAQGRRLRVWMDGVLLADVMDGAHAAGRVGLYTSHDATASFDGWSVLDETLQVGRWEVIDQGHISRPSDWRITGGVLHQRANINDGDLDGAPPAKLGTVAVTGDPDWNDYRISARIRAEDDDALGIVFRYVDDDNYYRLSLDEERQYRRLIKRTAGIATTLWESSGGYDIGVEFELTVEAVGTHLRGFLDSALLFEITDGDHDRGRIGMYTYGSDDVRFDSVRVRRPTLETSALFRDRFDEDDVTDWTIVDKGTIDAPSAWAVAGGEFRQSSNIHSNPTTGALPEKEGTYAVTGDASWTDIALQVRLESRDDDALGLMLRYTDDDNYYRFSMDREQSYRRLVSKKAGVFRVLWEDHFPYDQDRQYELTLVASGDFVEGYLDGVRFFRIVDSDHVQGRIALYSWGNDDSRFSKVRVFDAKTLFDGYALEDRFLVLKRGRWAFLDEGTVGGPSEWTVSSSRLRQTSSIHGSDPGTALGTNAVAGDPTWEDYRVTATVLSTTGGGLGVMFRAGTAGYYRFAIDRDAGTRYLLKRVGTTFSVLASESFTFDLDTDYTLSVECLGSHLTCYINGVEVFALEDTSLARGAVGLYAHNNPGAQFDDITVILRQWLPFYRFGKERTLPAGTRLRVVSGRTASALPTDPLETVRYASQDFEQGSPLLPASAVDLRVNTPDGPGHQRRFLADGVHASVPFAWLRRADGTGYALVPVGSSTFARGEYRLRFTYSRNAAPQKLSERGETSDEVVQIDVPAAPKETP